MNHSDRHPLAGQTVKLRGGVTDPVQGAVVGGAEFRVEDWWDRIAGKSGTQCDGNIAAMHYGMRTGLAGPGAVPLDDEVVYGKIDSLGHIVHVSEIAEDAS
jgi:hypothetical protein